MMKAILNKILLMSVACMIVILSACQPTPDDEVVITKNQDEMLEIIDESTDSTNNLLNSIPDSWQQESFGSEVEISINAEIILPETNSVSTSVVISNPISQSTADILLNYFTEGKTLYNESLELTKDDYAEQILSLEANINDPDADWRVATQDDAQAYESALSKKESELENLRELYTQAPETIELTFADTKFHEAAGEDQPGLDDIISSSVYEINGCIQSDSGNIAYLYIYNSDNGSGVTYSNLPESSYVLSPNISTLAQTVNYQNYVENNSLDMTEDEAVTISKNILETLEIGDVSLYDLGIGKVYSPNETFSEHKNCYVIIYTRNYSGILQTYDSESINYENLYGEVLPYESVIMYINDEGLVGFEWNSPVKIVEVLSENVTMMAFENVMDIFEEQIQIQGIYGDELVSVFHEFESKEIIIDKITLTMERIKMQDSSDEYLIVPAWNFYGIETNNYIYSPSEGESEIYTITSRLFSHSYLTINAIDGSIIDRSLGY